MSNISLCQFSRTGVTQLVGESENQPYKTKFGVLSYLFSAKNNSEIDKPLGCVGSYKVINADGNIANKAKQMGELANEKNTASSKPSFSTIGISSKGTNNEPEYAVSNKIKFINSIVKDEPTYSVPYDRVVMQEVANNNVYSVIGENYIDNEVYYDAIGKEDHSDNEVYYEAVGKEDHIYDEINYGAIEEKAEPIYEEIGNYASDKTVNHPNSNQKINLAQPNDFSPFEKAVFTAVELNKKRTEIADLAEQTFAAPKSLISRLASSIWNVLFGSKNESEIMAPANLVARAMQVNIEGICDRFNEYIEKKTISGAFRQQPSSDYSLTDSKKLVNTFNKDASKHDAIELSFLLKSYLGHNFPKFEFKELNNVFLMSGENNNMASATDNFNELMKNKLKGTIPESVKNNLATVFQTIANALRLAESEKKIDGLTKESIITSMFPQLVDDMCAFELGKDRAEKKLNKSNDLDKLSQFNNLIANYFINQYK